MGATYKEVDIPAELADQAASYRESLVEAAAEASEALMDKYIGGESLTVEEINEGLRVQTIANEVVPVLCGSAFKNKGVQAMLDAVVEYMPSPVDVPAIEGELDDGSSVSRNPTDDEPFAHWPLRSRPTPMWVR